MDTVGDRIRRIRELRGLSQKELATKAGIHEVLMRRYEYGDRNPKANQLAKIADALHVPETFFHIPNVETADALFALLFELVDCFGDISLENQGGQVSITLPVKDRVDSYQPLQDAVTKKSETSDSKQFQKWLLDYRYSCRVTADFSTRKFLPLYPNVEEHHQADYDE